MEPLQIRRATFQDIEKLLVFEQGIIEAERPFDSTLQKGHIHYYDIVQMIKAPNIELVVAVLNNIPVGSGYARIEEAKHYLKHAKHAYLGFMYVEPEHRGKGINQKIVETLKDWTHSQNIRELRLDVYHDNLNAIRAYEKAGFSRHMVEMRMGV